MTPLTASSRLDHLDATRAFALVLGVVFHAGLSFMPVFIGWAVQDVSTSPIVAILFTASHSFRMPVFFLLAGFFSHMVFHRSGTRAFILSRTLRIVVPFVTGWFILHPLIISGWNMGFASMRGDYAFWPAVGSAFKSLEKLPSGIFTQSHLWFLYYLAMITALAVAARWVLTRRESWHRALAARADALASWLARSPVALPALVLPTAAVLWRMQIWGLDTPDRSLVPHIPVLLIYGGFFGLGWLFHRTPELIDHFSRLTPVRCIAAALAIAATILLGRVQMDPGSPHFNQAHIGFVVSYALMMWTLVALTIGIFGKVCRRPSPAVRYVADSSYWMYLIHLPIVVWLQVAIAEVPLHWSLKLAFISATTIGVSLLSYDLFVRSTFLGWLLNGRRRERVIFARRGDRRSQPVSVAQA